MKRKSPLLTAYQSIHVSLIFFINSEKHSLCIVLDITASKSDNKSDGNLTFDLFNAFL